jgi:homoserine dehydrogenase
MTPATVPERITYGTLRRTGHPGATTAARRATTIAVAGCGVVGDAFVRLVHDQREAVRQRLGPHSVTHVLVRDRMRPREALQSGALRTEQLITDEQTLLTTPPDVLVEATGDVTLGLALATRTLLSGGRVITANKQLVARHGPALAALAPAHGGRFDFEAAVGGALPVIRALRAGAAGSAPTRLRGILNGTTNFLLDRLATGLTYDEALTEAQQLGFAEADPTRDVEGFDTADKLRIVAWLALGVEPREVRVTTRGIARDAEQLQRAAAHLGGVCIKLLGEVRAHTDGVHARVEPVLVSTTSPWGVVRGPGNRLEISGGVAGTLSFEGAGAGGSATASALLGDLLSPGTDTLTPLVPQHTHDAVPTADQWLVGSPEGSFYLWSGTRSALAAHLRDRSSPWAVRLLTD